MKKTLKQKLSEMRKLCRRLDRCKDFSKECALEKQLYKLHLSIINQASFEGVKWTLDSLTTRKWVSKRDRWKMQISASILSKRGDMKIFADSYRIGSELSGEKLTMWIDDSIHVTMNPAVVIIDFSDREAALRFLRRHKILIDMTNYISIVRRRIADLEADIVEKQKFVIRTNKETFR